MSRTTKPIGSPNGHAVVDKDHFSNPGQNTRLDAGKQATVDAQRHSPTSAPRTITGNFEDRDQMRKTSAPPNVGLPNKMKRVQGASRSIYEQHGK